jgi:hypothetical protein
MTKLTDRPLVRETAVANRGGPLIVELHPKYLLLRIKGQRSGVTADYESILDLARKIAYRRQGGRL